MAIDPKRYGKGPRRGRDHRVQINIRLRRHHSIGGPPNANEVIECMETILDTGVVPNGWQFAAIEWNNPKFATESWQTGTVRDFDQFRAVIASQLNNMRIATVRPDR